MAILCYKIVGQHEPNDRSTTGAIEGHLSAVIKSDHPDAKAQVYSELVANRLAMFLGIPVALGVPAKDIRIRDELRFASLRAWEEQHDLYDFTSSDDRGLDPPENLPVGMITDLGHANEFVQLSELYPREISQIAVFDLWIGNADRHLNFKAELSKSDRGIIFALDQGSSLLSCKANIDTSLDQLCVASFPSFHPFQKLVNPIYVGQMVERISNMPEWAIEAATVYDDIIGNVTMADQYALYEVLIHRKRFLKEQINMLVAQSQQ